jgi:putative transposase
LIRYHVLFVIRLATREVKIVGIVPESDEGWMRQIARNVTDCIDGFLKEYKYLIHDRRTQFSKAVKMILDGGGVKTVRLPRQSPNLSPFAERWVRKAKELCINRMIFFGEGSLRRALTEVEIFYNQERPHQGIGNKIILPNEEELAGRGVIDCRSRQCGLLNYYHRKAA